MSKPITADEFRTLAIQKLAFLQEHGFIRNESEEELRSTFCTVVYMGQNVAFVISLDIRDQCIDAEVVEVLNGKLCREWDGGYSSDLFDHFVRHEGYRGSPTVNAHGNDEDELERMFDGLVSLLANAGQNLLSDDSDSLPGGC